ncbi:hypothetical protein PRUB_a5115 [Pseudoalteromonas rubra]|uniref:Uncharacterized protein n=1 Tax=Pseudoalteromonas rubra TaxID=43658 RepID=A0A8T0C373_9GAMM|nr:hypothetical protein PRUB_a5115 [Pseudoalteromonas rubra]
MKPATIFAKIPQIAKLDPTPGNFILSVKGKIAEKPVFLLYKLNVLE